MAETMAREGLRRSALFRRPRGHLLTLVLGGALACSAARNSSRGEPAPTVAPTTPAAESNWCHADALVSSESKQGVAGPLASLNAQFLKAHARARARECVDLLSNRLVLRYAFGSFEARLRGQQIISTFVIPPEYHPVKDVSHAVFLAALLFAEPAGTQRDRDILETLSALEGALAQLQDPTSATARLLPQALHPREKRLLQATHDAVARFSKGELTIAAKGAYFQTVRPDVIANLRDVARASLKSLSLAVEATRASVAKLDPGAWDSVLVVVGVMHQARAREIGVQYFERLLHEAEGEGARGERRLVVAENMTAPADQLGLLSAHLVDQEGAAEIFGDPLRLQWDALGDVDGATLDALFHP